MTWLKWNAQHCVAQKCPISAFSVLALRSWDITPAGLRCRGVALGVTSQLSASFPSINMSGFKFGNGDNALLLGTNVIGAIVAWGLMAITLLENPFGSQLAQVSSVALGLTTQARCNGLCRSQIAFGIPACIDDKGPPA